MRASGYERTINDWYVEPAWAVDALVKAERPFIGRVWDPCCGGGNIPMRLAWHKVNAFGTDLIDRGFGTGGWDFFTTTADATSIVSNPPYDRAQEFVDRALTIAADRVCVLFRLAFLEGQARKPWFASVPLARVWVSSKRMSMPPGGTDVPASGGTIAYAWFVFEADHVGAPAIGWI